ncbi:MAG TPA: hypothetical protein DEA08_33925 [Planctomycetes bacterium]|nr:hypothetical protein [Planctomycetota bacterium]
MSDDGIGMGFGFKVGTGDENSTPPKDGAPKLAPVSGAVAELPPPRVLVVANLRGNPAARDGRRVRVDPGALDEAIAAAEPSLFFTVTDLLRGDEKGLEVRLAPRCLADLGPEAVAAALDACDLPRKLLSELEAAEAGSLSRDELAAGLGLYDGIPGLSEAVRLASDVLRGGGAAPAPAPSAPAEAKPGPPAGKSTGDSVLDSILNMVDTGEPPPPKPAPTKGGSGSAIGGVISAIGGGKQRSDLSAARDATRAALDRQLDLVLHHPQFREVESAWRGLRLLTQGPAARKIRVEALDAERSGFAEAFHTHAYPGELAGEREPALALTLVDVALANTSADLAQLEQLAADAEQLQAPVIVSLAPDFTGAEPAKLAGMGNPAALFETGFAEWRGKRKQDGSRWALAAYNRLLLRAPHAPSKRSGYSEAVAGPADLLWGNAGWAYVAGVAESMLRTGWPANLSGGELADRPMWQDGEGELHGPLEARLSQDCLEDLAAEGIAALTARKGRDAVLLPRTPLVHRPSKEERAQSHLGYQLLAARLGEAVLTHKAKLSGLGPEQVLAAFERYLQQLVATTGPGGGVVVQGMPDPEDSQRLLVGMTARTGRAVLGGVDVHLGVRV